MVASGLNGDGYMDGPPLDLSQSYCYSLQNRFATGTRSQRKAFCWWGANCNIQSYGAQGFEANAGLSSTTTNWHWRLGCWQRHAHHRQYQPSAQRRPLVTGALWQWVWPNQYGNYLCRQAHHRLRWQSRLSENGTVFLRQTEPGTWADSTLVPVTLEAGKVCIQSSSSQDANSINMSEFEYFALYSGTGGTSGPSQYPSPSLKGRFAAECAIQRI